MQETTTSGNNTSQGPATCWTLENLQTLIRAALKFGGGYLVARGISDNNTLEAITAGALALTALIWSISKRGSNSTNPPPSKSPLLILPLLGLLLISCATANTTAFRAEKLATDSAYASLLAWKAYYQAAITNTPPEERAALSNRNEHVYAASRSFAAVMSTADSLREACATNAAASNRTALQMTLSIAQSQASNLVWLVTQLTAPPSPQPTNAPSF